MENLKWFVIPKFTKYEINELLQVRHRENKKIKSVHLKQGYMAVNLQKNEGGKSCKCLHQLVGWTFIPNPENKPELHHIDEDKLNNLPSNLMWVTKAEHAEISRINEQRAFKISRADVVWIRDNYSESNKHKLAKQFDVREVTIYNIAIGISREDVIGGKIHPPVGLFKRIINIETCEIINSSKELAVILGVKKIKEVHRRLNGERYNDTPYRYVGMENVLRERPEKIIEPSPIGVFDLNWGLVKTFSYKKDAANFVGEFDCHRINDFLRGKVSFVKGYKFKEIDDEGNFIEPIQFISKKPPLKPKRIKQPVTPSKELIKYNLDGEEVDRFKSIGEAARSMGVEKRNFRRKINESPRNYYKGYIFKYA